MTKPQGVVDQQYSSDSLILQFLPLFQIYVTGQIEPSGQFVSTQVNLFQPRSVCFNLGQLVLTQVSSRQVQNTDHRTLFYQIIQKVS